MFGDEIKPGILDTCNPAEAKAYDAGCKAGAESMKAKALECVSIPGTGWSDQAIIAHIKNAISQL